MVDPSRFVQRLRFQGQCQLEIAEHGDFQLPTAHPGHSPVNPAARRSSHGPQLAPLCHQRRRWSEGVFLVVLLFQRDHPGVGHPVVPPGRTPGLRLVVHRHRLGLTPLLRLSLQTGDPAPQLLQLAAWASIISPSPRSSSSNAATRSSKGSASSSAPSPPPPASAPPSSPITSASRKSANACRIRRDTRWNS